MSALALVVAAVASELPPATHLGSGVVPTSAPGRGLAALGAVSNYQWVIAQPFELHAQACARAGKKATATEVELLWDESAMAQVVTGIGYSSKGQQGCCVAGMWCNAATASCETHHFGRTFVNHGWVGGEDDLAPVYTCEDLDAGEKRPTITAVSLAGGNSGTKITITGSNFGSKKSDVSVILGGKHKSTCDDVEFCHNICKACGGVSGSGADTVKCGENEECIKDEPAGGRCLPYCDPQVHRSCLCPSL